MKTISVLAVLAFFAVSCSESISKPSFQFKPASRQGVVAKMGDTEITEQELVDGAEAEIYEAEQKLFEVKFNKLRSVIMQKLMDKDPNKKNLTNDEYMDKYIAGGVKVTDKDVDAFIKKQSIPQEHLNPMVREKIKNYLEMEKKKEAMDKWLAEQTKKTPVEVYIPKPKRPSYEITLGDAPVTGGKDAKVTVVEFSDFQCPFCAKGAEVVQELKKKYGSKIKVAFKNFPLPFHNQAEGAAVAGLCANEQSAELFWKLHDEMFAHQDMLDVENLKKAARKVGAKGEQFDQCLTSNKHLARVKADIEEGKKINVKSTPTFFINGQMINGAQPIEVFSELIDEELAK